ncbi:hypothetical protein FBU59_003492 [Linderina macrospora]|uniref:Uncharacterized protein n=1 Tax=Linderina macrospora TaxID=4868 RepID=A0ACC1J8B2_9FUNG|nr:hypothetical protein FBU59_003492 [Linderina macrospora]
MTEHKITVKSVDMSEAMQNEIVALASKAFDENKLEKDIAAHVKREADRQFGPTWHVVVGRNFGSYVTHETGNFIYFYVDHTAVLLFKSG